MNQELRHGHRHADPHGGGPGPSGLESATTLEAEGGADFSGEAVESECDGKEHVCEIARLVAVALQRGDADGAIALLPCLGFMSES